MNNNKINDVIVFAIEKDLFVHRIVEKNANGSEIMTKGDNNTFNDQLLYSKRGYVCKISVFCLIPKT